MQSIIASSTAILLVSVYYGRALVSMWRKATRDCPRDCHGMRLPHDVRGDGAGGPLTCRGPGPGTLPDLHGNPFGDAGWLRRDGPAPGVRGEASFVCGSATSGSCVGSLSL
jgi:hypothetical protein